jgi:hypothetical protein
LQQHAFFFAGAFLAATFFTTFFTTFFATFFLAAIGGMLKNKNTLKYI